MKLSSDVFMFLKELKQNNHKEWFFDHKNKFNEIQKELIHFTANLLSKVESFDPSLKGVDPKSCIFRIYKDVRFSKDKSPYKTHFGIFIRGGGKKINQTGYYLHIEPNASLLGGGCYQPDPKSLYKIRERIVKNPNLFKKIIEEKKFIETFGKEFYATKVKTAPRGFAKDHPMIEILKYKGFAVVKKLKNADVTSKDSIESFCNDFRLLYPLNSFLEESMK